MLKSMLFDKDFQTWHLIGWQHSRQPIRSHVRKSLLTDMEFHVDFNRQSRGPLATERGCFWAGDGKIDCYNRRTTDMHRTTHQPIALYSIHWNGNVIIWGQAYYSIRLMMPWRQVCNRPSAITVLPRWILLDVCTQCAHIHLTAGIKWLPDWE